jgi:release factor glutamine methyltransferase
MFSRIKTLKEAFQNFQSLIQRNYEIEEARSITKIVFKEILGYDTIQLILNENDLLPASIFEQLDYIAFQLNEHKPIQYILRHTDFYGLKFEVNESVLIPRPETEELVDWIIKDHKESQSLNILDIGTGSGCIPVSLKFNLPQAKVSSIDVSKEAIAIALKNSIKNNVPSTNKLKFYEGEFEDAKSKKGLKVKKLLKEITIKDIIIVLVISNSIWSVLSPKKKKKKMNLR